MVLFNGGWSIGFGDVWIESVRERAVSPPRTNRAFNAGRRPGKLSRDRRSIAGRVLTFRRYWENLSFAHCPNGSLAGVILSHLPQVLSETPLSAIEGRATVAKSECYIGAPYTRF